MISYSSRRGSGADGIAFLIYLFLNAAMADRNLLHP